MSLLNYCPIHNPPQHSQDSLIPNEWNQVGVRVGNHVQQQSSYLIHDDTECRLKLDKNSELNLTYFVDGTEYPVPPNQGSLIQKLRIDDMEGKEFDDMKESEYDDMEDSEGYDTEESECDDMEESECDDMEESECDDMKESECDDMKESECDDMKELKLKQMINFLYNHAVFNVQKLTLGKLAVDVAKLTKLASLYKKDCVDLVLEGCYYNGNMQLIFRLFPNLKKLKVKGTENWLKYLVEANVTGLEMLWIVNLKTSDSIDDAFREHVFCNLNAKELYELCKAQPPSFQLRLGFNTNECLEPMIWKFLKPYFRKVRYDCDAAKVVVTNRRKVYHACFTSVPMTSANEVIFNNTDSCCDPEENTTFTLFRSYDKLMLKTDSGRLCSLENNNSMIIKNLVIDNILSLSSEASEADSDFTRLLSEHFSPNFSLLIVQCVDTSILHHIASFCSKQCRQLELHYIGRDVNFQHVFDLFPNVKKVFLRLSHSIYNWLNELLESKVTQLEKLHIDFYYSESIKAIQQIKAESLYKLCKAQSPNFQLRLDVRSLSLNIGNFLGPFFHKVKNDYDHPKVVISITTYFSYSRDMEVYCAVFAQPSSCLERRNGGEDGSKVFENETECVPQSMVNTNNGLIFEKHGPVNENSGLSQDDSDEDAGDRRPISNSASARRKHNNKKFEGAVRLNLGEAEVLFKNFPDIKLGEKKAHAKSYFEKDNVKFALLVLTENAKFREFKDMALSLVTKTAELVLRAVDENGMFTKKDIEGILFALEKCGISKDDQDTIRSRINEWKKKMRQADETYRRPQAFDMDKVLDDIAKLSGNVDDIVSLYKETVPARLHWIKKKRGTIADALQKFPHYKSYSKLIIDVDFSHRTKWKPSKIGSIGDFFRDQQHALISLALYNQLFTLEESEKFATDVTALLTLPRLVKYYGKKSSNAKSCNIFVPKPDERNLESAKSAVLRDQVLRAFITCATVDTKLAFAVVIDNTTFTVDGDAFDALDVFIKLHYSFNVEPSEDYKFLYEFLKAIMFDKKLPMHMKFLSNLKTSNEMLCVKEPRPTEVKPPKSQLPHASVSENSQSQPLRSQIIINPEKGKHPLLYSNPNVALLQQKCNVVGIDWICSYQVPTEPKVLQDCRTITTLNVASDGHCGFSSVSMLLSGVPTNHMVLREAVGKAIINGTFEKAKEFYEFCSPGLSIFEKKRTLAAKAVGKMYAEDAHNPETWWDFTDSLALALHLQINIVVYDDSQQVWTVWNETTMPNPCEARVLEHLPTILLFLKNDHYMPIINVE